MNREYDREELIDLGAVSTETKGPTGVPDDSAGGRIQLSGLSDE
jgi:hypothetical protein